MSILTVRFTTRTEHLPEFVTRYVEYDPTTRTGIIWYGVLNRTIRCIHDPVAITTEAQFVIHVVSYLRDGSFERGWPEPLLTCEEANLCSWKRHAEYLEATRAG
jgi:hypothetical protein